MSIQLHRSSRPVVRRAGLPLGCALLAGLLGPPSGAALRLDPPAASACSEDQESQTRDSDHDGVPDIVDRCPDRAGPVANLGCPDRDEDNDGVIDRLDACPTVPGSPAARGCPDGNTMRAQDQGPGQPQAGPPPASGPPPAQAGHPAGGDLAQLRGKSFAWPEPVSFDPGGDTLTERGRAEVEAAARVLISRPDLRHVVIEGHVDEPGNTAARARDLSRQRAEMVKKVLVQAGVAPERLRTQGFGYSRLLDRSETPAAQKRNNRIEIVVE